MTKENYTPGHKAHGFVITEVTELKELNLTLVQLRHENTGARMVHLDTADSNNLFAVTFRTPPADSTGVAHILEHTVLCGSKRFPVRDPFFSMLKRSLNTFMNALTSSDWTSYPFASLNQKDFYNLLDIYLDAAFFPMLRERDFRQEGHRLEFATPEDSTSDLTFKGVVFNEMKGAMASPSSLLARRLSKALYPTTCYHHNSGGEPSDIPDLSWQQLRDFHARYYHPSNAWFFTYGDMALEKHLAVIEEKALRHFQAAPLDSEVAPEIRKSEPWQVEEEYALAPGEPLENKSMVQVAWLTCDITDSFERLALGLLSSLLMGNPAAPLYKALLDSKLGQNLSPACGYHDESRTTCFAAGLQGTDPDKVEAIEKLILDTLEAIACEGFTEERIEATIHRLEFSYREVSGDHYPYPLNLLMRMLGPWLHGEDPVSPLLLDANLKRLREELAKGPFFSHLIRTRLLENPHRVTLLLKPNHGLEAKMEQEMAQRLEKIATGLKEEDRTRIVEQSLELLQAQEEQEDLSCLPTLGREDIPAQEKSVLFDFTRERDQKVQWFEQPTNGIGYFMAHLPLGSISEELLPYVPLFCSLLTQVGSAGQSYLDIARRIEAGTGGISLGTEILEHPEQAGRFQALVTLKGKALVRNQDKLFGLLVDLVTAPDFSDLARLHTVINQVKTSLENSIPGSGHSYASRSAASGLTASAALRESWTGISQFRLVRALAARPAQDLTDFADKLKQIAVHLFDREQLSLAIVAEASSFAGIRQAMVPFLDALPQPKALSNKTPEFAPAPERKGLSTSVPVNYVARVFSTVPYTHPDTATLTVLAKLLRAGFLHREIREKGGAYGGLAGYDPEAGLFSLLSYRDPQLSRTLRVYDEALDWARNGSFTDEEIAEAILAVFADLDRPLSPNGLGYREFANTRQGMTLAMRQQMRKRVLACDRKALASAAERYLYQNRDASAVAVVAGEEALTKANAELGEMALKVEKI